MKTRTLIFSLSFFLLGLSGCSTAIGNEDLLTGSKWEFYGYKTDGLTQMLPLTDTLVFSALPSYTYNHVPYSYSLYSTANGNQSVRLQLNDTRFGTVSGVIQTASVSSGTILGETFSRATDQVAWQFWLRKI